MDGTKDYILSKRFWLGLIATACLAGVAYFKYMPTETAIAYIATIWGIEIGGFSLRAPGK